MNQEQITANKTAFIALCQQHIRRDGLTELLDYLEQSDFYTAPSSKGYHLNEDGGLCLHSMNVFHTAYAIYNQVIAPAIQSGESPFTEPVSAESIAIATLFHDLCKINIYHKSERWKKDEQGRWISYPGYEIKDNFPFGHGEKSCIMLSWFLKLRQEELLAIRWHMGMFEITESGSSTRFAYREAMGRSPLVSLLQVADMTASNCLEKTTNH